MSTHSNPVDQNNKNNNRIIKYRLYQGKLILGREVVVQFRASQIGHRATKDLLQEVPKPGGPNNLSMVYICIPSNNLTLVCI